MSSALVWLSCLSLWHAAHEQRRIVPPRLTLAVAWVESRCGANARTSSAGAIGVMQIMPFWARTNLAHKCGRSLRDAKTSVCYGTRILRHYLVRCRGNVNCALARYSGRAEGYSLKVRRAMRAQKGWY